jgi:hypothetical protein
LNDGITPSDDSGKGTVLGGEVMNRSVPVHGEPSVYGIGHSSPDLKNGLENKECQQEKNG